MTLLKSKLYLINYICYCSYLYYYTYTYMYVKERAAKGRQLIF